MDIAVRPIEIAEHAERGPCVVTDSHKDKDGYGKVKSKEAGNTIAEHRAAYCAHHNIPLSKIKGLVVRHRCDNAACVNPHHLELGTQADNIRDRDDRGRTAKGMRNASAKLNDQKVAFIRANHKKRDPQFGAAALARKYGVSAGTIWWVLTGGTWSDETRGAAL